MISMYKGLISSLFLTLFLGAFVHAGQKGLVDAARSQIGKTLIYDGSYQSMKYPNGDVSFERGVCTDVVIRALRASSHDIDLQKVVHLDMKSNFSLLFVMKSKT